jgi:hypothetical protein
VFELNNWIPVLFNLGRRQNISRVFGRRNNRGMMWASLLGLGVSAAAYGLGRNRNRNMMAPIQDLLNNIQNRNSRQMPNMANLTEFSKELAPNKDSNKNN